jgi:hypothetical protein
VQEWEGEGSRPAVNLLNLRCIRAVHVHILLENKSLLKGEEQRMTVITQQTTILLLNLHDGFNNFRHPI